MFVAIFQAFISPSSVYRVVKGLMSRTNHIPAADILDLAHLIACDTIYIDVCSCVRLLWTSPITRSLLGVICILPVRFMVASSRSTHTLHR